MDMIQSTYELAAYRKSSVCLFDCRNPDPCLQCGVLLRYIDFLSSGESAGSFSSFDSSCGGDIDWYGDFCDSLAEENTDKRRDLYACRVLSNHEAASDSSLSDYFCDWGIMPVNDLYLWYFRYSFNHRWHRCGAFRNLCVGSTAETAGEGTDYHNQADSAGCDVFCVLPGCNCGSDCGQYTYPKINPVLGFFFR